MKAYIILDGVRFVCIGKNADEAWKRICSVWSGARNRKVYKPQGYRLVIVDLG